jgi:hypothetical protein
MLARHRNPANIDVQEAPARSKAAPKGANPRRARLQMPKDYEFIGVGAMGGTKPYEFIGFATKSANSNV